MIFICQSDKVVEHINSNMEFKNNNKICAMLVTLA